MKLFAAHSAEHFLVLAVALVPFHAHSTDSILYTYLETLGSYHWALVHVHVCESSADCALPCLFFEDVDDGFVFEAHGMVDCHLGTVLF